MSRSHALFDQWYECGDKKFLNIWQAFDYQKKSGHFPHYRFDQEFLNSIKNIKRPKNLNHQYIKNLIVTRLRQLRQQYKYLRLALGGGTDSFSILKYCVEHDIYLDEVFCEMTSVDKTLLKPNIEFEPALRFAEQHIGKNIGRVIRSHPTINELESVLSEGWYKDSNIVRGNHLPGRWHILSVYYKKTKLPIEETLTITGIDKPSILRHEDKFYWCQLDSTISEIMGCKNIIPLFFDKENPELSVAMTYGLLDTASLSNTLINYSNQPKHKKLGVLHSMGLESTGHHYIDFHVLGKNVIDIHNKKNQLFHKELKLLNRKDIRNAFYSSVEKVYNDYKDLPHAIHVKDGKYSGTVKRYTQEIPIYQDFFGA